VEGQALVSEHDVIGAGNRDDERDAGRGEQHQQAVHVVLVGLGMVGIADVHTHRQAEQLAAEVILESGPDDLLAVVQVLRPDEADHGVHQQRLELPGDAVGAGFESLLVHGLTVDTQMGTGRECRPLTSFEVHDVIADGAPTQIQRRGTSLGQHVQLHPERGVAALGAGDRLEHQVDRRALPDQVQRRRDVGEHAGLGGNVEAGTDVVQQPQQFGDGGRRVRRRVDADDRVPGVGWFGWRRVASRPGRPRVLRNAVVT
jgi:hypothetical protein